MSKRKSHFETTACSFQGGGALGAYQVGVLHAIEEAGYHPDWYVGTSIGAINAAIAAGNPEKVRIEKMHEFWDLIATPSLTPDIESSLFDDPATRKMQHLWSSQSALFFGQPGFFVPRIPSPQLGLYNTPDELSYYDTSPLRSTLERFIDFDRINSNETRLSVGAVEICSGRMVYFDSAKQKIGPEHIMASGALPPGFPGVCIDDKFYWDGGISSNTPATYILSSQECPKNLLCFAIHLFDSYGLDPINMDEVTKRKKDIEFSSRHNTLLDFYKLVHTLKNSIHALSKYVPKDQKLIPEVKECIERGHETNISLVHFLYQYDDTEFSSKDFEFSRKSINERIKRGYKDGKRGMKKSPWLEPVPNTSGIVIHDLASRKYLNKDRL